MLRKLRRPRPLSLCTKFKFWTVVLIPPKVYQMDFDAFLRYLFFDLVGLLFCFARNSNLILITNVDHDQTRRYQDREICVDSCPAVPYSVRWSFQCLAILQTPNRLTGLIGVYLLFAWAEIMWKDNASAKELYRYILL